MHFRKTWEPFKSPVQKCRRIPPGSKAVLGVGSARFTPLHETPSATSQLQRTTRWAYMCILYLLGLMHPRLTHGLGLQAFEKIP